MEEMTQKFFELSVEAARDDPYSVITRTFLLELYSLDINAYDYCCTWIAEDIIGG